MKWEFVPKAVSLEEIHIKKKENCWEQCVPDTTQASAGVQGKDNEGQAPQDSHKCHGSL